MKATDLQHSCVSSPISYNSLAENLKIQVYFTLSQKANEP